MADNRTASVTLRADTTQYQRAMRQASSATSEMDKAQAKAQRNAQRWEAIGIASKVAGAAVAAGLLYAAKAASNQEQALGALQSVFRDNTAAMEANARSATKLGLSTTDYANNAARLGAQLGNLGVDQKDLGVITDDLIKKAADLAAQTGGTTTEAVDALAAAFRGEADPAERYGLALNITAVNAEMAATGADKAQATLSLLNKQMERSGSIGAWNREMDTVASQVQIARAEFDDATASLGEALLPALTKAAQAASALIGAFNGLPEGMKEATTYMVAFGGAALLAGPKIAAAGKAVADLAVALGAAGKAGPALTAVFGGAAAGGTLIAATAAVSGQKAAIDNLSGSMEEATGWNRQFIDGLTNISITSGPPATMAVNGLLGALESFAGLNQDSITGWARGLLGMDDELQGFVDRINAGEGDLRTFMDAVNAGQAPADAFAAAQQAAAAATQDSADASYKDAEAKENQAAATKKAVEAYEAYLESVRQALGLLDARDALIGQEERLAEAVKENGAALRGRTKAAVANREVLSGEAENIANLVQQTYENVAAKKDEAAGLRAANRVRREQIRTLIDNAQAAGLDRDQVRGLLRQLNLLKPIKTSVTVTGVEKSAQEIRQLAGLMGSLSGQFLFDAPRPRQRRAAGGYISGPGGPTADKIPAMLSNGEYVMRASAVDRLGVGFFDALNYATGGVVGYARGGRARGRGGRGGRGDGPPRLGAALRETQRWTDAVQEARQNLDDLLEQRADFAASFSSGVIGNAGPSIFQQFSQAAVDQARGNLEDAQRARAEAADELQAARVALNNSSPEERAAALDRLTKAQAAYNSALGGEAAAQQAANNAAPTGANILASAKERADRVIKYAKDVKALMAKGMSMAMIKDLAGEDILQAGPIIDALLQMPADQFAELQATDARMRAAADSLGTSVAKQEFAPQVMDARINLTASQDSLDKAIKKADKTVDKQWRKKLAKIGLGAEERVQLMQSLRDNDGKLTRYWRNVLAKAGLGAEERKELLEGIGFADQTAEREWRSKLQNTGLSAEERKELAEELAAAKNPERALRRYWIDELQETGLSAKESKALYDEIIDAGSNPSRALKREWKDKLQETGLSAREAADLISKIQGSQGSVNTHWVAKTFNTGLGAQAGPLDGDIRDKGNPKVKANWEDLVNNTGLGAQAGPLDNDINTKGKPKVKANWEDKTSNTGLGAQAGPLGGDIDSKGKPKVKSDWEDKTFNSGLGASVNGKAIDGAVENAKSRITSGFQGFAVSIGTAVGGTIKPPKKKKEKKSATGGLILGPGTATSDSIPAMLSNGEFVIRAASVSRYGTDLLTAINTGRFASGGPVGFRTTTAAPASAVGGVTLATSGVPIVVRMDNRTVATGQLKLQRQSGGTVTLGG